jgi:hypothetical protein
MINKFVFLTYLMTEHHLTMDSHPAATDKLILKTLISYIFQATLSYT